MVAPLAILGWMLVTGLGGTSAVVADSTLNDGKLRTAAGRVFGQDWSAKNIKEKVGDKIDQTASDTAYDNIIKPLGVEKSTYDEWWNTINPAGNAGVFAGIIALDKTLEQIGIDVIDAKTAAALTVAYHFLITKGYGKQFLDYFTGTGELDLAGTAPPWETPPRIDPMGFGTAAARQPAAKAQERPIQPAQQQAVVPEPAS